MARDGAGERITSEIEGLKVVAEAKGIRNISGEIEIGELQTYDPVLLLVPALDAGEAADGAGGGVGEIPGESVVGISQRAVDFAQAVEVIFGGGERGKQQREGEEQRSDSEEMNIHVCDCGAERERGGKWRG